MKGWVYRMATGALVLAWMAVIYCFSSQIAEDSSRLSGGVCDEIVSTANEAFRMNMTEPQKLAASKRIEHPVRKMAHMTEFGVLGLLCFAFYHGIVRKELYKYLFSLATVIAYAASDELHQYFIDGRAAQAKDVLIDTSGALIGLAVLYFILKLARKHCEKKKYHLQ